MPWKATCECGTCKKCRHRVYMRRFYAKNPDYAKLSLRKRKEREPDVVRAQQRAAYAADPQRHMQRLRECYARHPERLQARRKLHYAVKVGRLVRPDACDECGKACKPHAHHHNYDLPLDVRWLCPSCHGLQHRT